MFGAGGPDLLLDEAIVPRGGGEELLHGADLSVAEGQGDGLGVLAAVVQQQAPEVGQGVGLGLGVAKQRGKPLVQVVQLGGGGADLVRGHEEVLLTE